MGLSENSVYPEKKKVLIGENDHQPVDIQGYPIFEANPHDAKALVHVHVSIFIQREDARPRDGKPAAHAQQNPMTTP
jgi:hypothetical protein